MEPTKREHSIKKLGFRRGRLLGKYRLQSKLGTGGYCEVWKATDTVEGIPVALKIPLINSEGRRDSQILLKEVKLVSRLRHPNILPVKNADIINGHAVMATEIGQKTLESCSRPMSVKRIVNIMTQVLSALAYAHQHRVIHCDVSPTNIFLFPDGRALLGDFGIGLVVQGKAATVEDFGTPGYVAPEQAYGKPTYHSDCFAVGLILYEFITGFLPSWPYRWPLKGNERLRQKTNHNMVRFLKKSLNIDPKLRYAKAGQMLEALRQALPKKILEQMASSPAPRKQTADWKAVRRGEFIDRYRSVFSIFHSCVQCGEPLAEVTKYCPWCGSDKNRFETQTRYEYVCPRCHKGILPEWHYCPWCYGPGFEKPASKKTKNVRYHAACRHCGGKVMRFMRYCPWCNRKIKKPWQSRPFPEVCGRCSWPVDSSYWTFCPWCKQRLNQ